MKFIYITPFLLLFILKISTAQQNIFFPLQGNSIESVYSGSLSYDNNIFLTGTFTGSLCTKKTTGKARGDSDVFIIALDKDKEELWTVSFGGFINEENFISEYGKHLLVNDQGRILVSGIFSEKALLGDEFEITSFGNKDLFVASLDRTGNLLWMKNFGGYGNESVSGMALNPLNGQIAVTGILTSPFIVEKKIHNNNGTSAFLAVYDSAGNFGYFHQLISQKEIRGRAVCFDKQGSLYWASNFKQGIDNRVYEAFGEMDCYIEKLSCTGEKLFDLSFGGISRDIIKKMVTDQNNNLIVAGNFMGTLVIEGQSIDSYGGQDIFIAVFSSTGTLLRLNHFGGVKFDEIFDIAVCETNEYIITGQFDHFVLDSVYTATDRDGFILLVNADLLPLGFETLGGYGMEHPVSVSVNHGQCLVSGYFNKSLEYDGVSYESSSYEDPFGILFDISEFRKSNAVGNTGVEPFFSLWPNPTDGMVYFFSSCDFDCQAIRFYSGDGKLLEEHLKPAPRIGLSTSALGKGVVFVELETSEKKYRKKLVVL